jgi:hypothetical protein
MEFLLYGWGLLSEKADNDSDNDGADDSARLCCC